MKAPLIALLRTALAELDAEGRVAAATLEIQVDATKDSRHGDFATNLALTLAKPMGASPRLLAQGLIERLPASPLVAKVEIAGPGFINFFLQPQAWQAVVGEVLDQGAAYGCDHSRSKGRVMVEFVSANPTGPLHIGHGRGAAYGDALASLLAVTGWEVHREYYINDAGRQVDILSLSVWLRLLELTGAKLPFFPRRGYPGAYIQGSAQTLFDSAGADLGLSQAAVNALFASLTPEATLERLDNESDDGFEARAKQLGEDNLDRLIERARSLLGERWERLQSQALEHQIGSIRATLEAFNVRYERWASERALVDSGAVETAIRRLRSAGHVYERDSATWLATGQFGDEKDRVLFKADGSATYFANDIAYHVDKLDRGFDVLIDVWGADHHGYIGRVRAALEALTGAPERFRVQLMQFVTLSSGRMGKRSGNFVTLQDLIDEVGADATRFFYLQRSHDQHLEFDLELATSQSNDNPVYYVQYAHARICSVFRQVGQAWDQALGRSALSRLVEAQEKHLLELLNRYPEMLAGAARDFTPHSVAFYLRELADGLHSYYNAHKFLVEDSELQAARLALIAAVRQVLANGLGVLGVKPKETM